MDNENYTNSQKEAQKPITNKILIAIFVVLLIFAAIWIFEATGIITKCGMCDKKVFSEFAHDFYGRCICNDCYDEYLKPLESLANKLL